MHATTEAQADDVPAHGRAVAMVAASIVGFLALLGLLLYPAVRHARIAAARTADT